MEIFGMDLGLLFTNPVAAIAGTLIASAGGILVFQLWKTFNSMFRPVSYIEKLYTLADRIVEKLDDSIIDIIRNKEIKKSIQKEMREVLIKRKKKIQALIERISD